MKEPPPIAWTERVSTVFVRQGQFAHDPKVVASYPPTDVTIERISDLLDVDLRALVEFLGE